MARRRGAKASPELIKALRRIEQQAKASMPDIPAGGRALLNPWLNPLAKTPPEKLKTRPRSQQLILEEVTALYPNRWANVPTSVIMQKVGNRMKTKNLPVPGRDTFLRALDRRK
jgi:hypothetical protein